MGARHHTGGTCRCAAAVIVHVGDGERCAWRRVVLRVDHEAAVIVEVEAEAVRDSVLTASGRLNPEHFGLPIFPPLPDDIEERVKYSNSKWDTQYGAEGRKRSIYIYQQRTLNMPFLQAFDSLVCDESRPRRRHSVTPLQALAMYNGSFVSGEALQFAKRLQKEAGSDPAAQINLAFRIAFARMPSSEETSQLTNLISESESPEAGLAGVCRVLLNSNEFVHVD